MASLGHNELKYSIPHKLYTIFDCALFCYDHIISSYWVNVMYSPIFFRVTSPLALGQTYNYPIASEVSEWVIKFNDLFQTADIAGHVVHISRAIITYTYTRILIFLHVDNTQYTCWKTNTKKWGHRLSRFVIGDSNYTSVYNSSKAWLIPWPK